MVFAALQGRRQEAQDGCFPFVVVYLLRTLQWALRGLLSVPKEETTVL